VLDTVDRKTVSMVLINEL